MTTALKVLRRQRYDLMGLAVLWGILGLAVSRSCAIDDEQARESLRGLAGVQVLVEDLKPDTEQAGLTGAQIQTDVELRLRQAGIPVLTREERLRTPGRPYLYVRVTTLQPDTGLFVFMVNMGLGQRVVVEHNSAHVYATTWDSPGIVGRAKLSTIRDTVKDRVDEFINAYLAVNPRPAGSVTPSSTSLRQPLIRQMKETQEGAGIGQPSQESSKASVEPAPRAAAPPQLAQSTPVPQPDPPLGVVRAYYADVNRHDVDAAQGKWKTPPPRLQDMVQLIEWFRIEDIQLVDVDASAAHVAVVVTGKRRDQSPERWGGTIALEKRAGTWKIVTMPLTKQ